jgi:multidrug efflux pump subunit AcrB
MTLEKVSHKGVIAWMVLNSKVANLLMVVLIAGGIYTTQSIKKEVFPDFATDEVQVNVSYSGASPEEVEQGISLAVEEALSNVEGLDEIESRSSEGSSAVSAELLADADRMQVFAEVQQAVSNISTMPVEAETPVVSMSSRKRQVLSLNLSGDISEWELRDYAEVVRDQLLNAYNVTQVEVRGTRNFEVHVEVDQLMLERLGVSLAQISSAISQASVERGGGSIKSESGEILLRVSSRAEWAEEFAQLPIIEQANGSTITLGEIATVTDSFEESISSFRYNGNNALSIDVYRVGDQTPTAVSEAVRDVIPDIQQTLPENVRIAVLSDRSEIYQARLDLLLKNAFMGLILVLILLTLFLEVRLALWVTLGIPTAFLGGMLFLPGIGVSINMISMFAFILALGIVVDDAIIAGENIYEYRQRGYSNIDAAIRGMQHVVTPLTFSILSNIVAFIPLMFLPGRLGLIFGVVPLVVISVFIISWVEAVLILPAHLAHAKSNTEKTGFFGTLSKLQASFADGLDHFIHRYYQPVLSLCLKWRYTTFFIGIAVFIIVTSFLASGRAGFSLFPRVESDNGGVTIVLPVGSPMSQMQAMEKRVLDSFQTVMDEVGRDDNLLGVESTISENTLSIVFFLEAEGIRNVETSDVVAIWRKTLGEVTGVESLLFESDIGGPGRGRALTVELSHRDVDTLRQAGESLASQLNDFPIVSDITDGFTEGKEQLDFVLLPKGERLGLTVSDISNQVRAAFYGDQAARQQRGRHEIKVLVRLKQDQRDSEYDLNQLKIVTPSGDFVSLYEVASVKRGHAYTSINRQSGKRVIRVEANVTPNDQTSVIISALNDGILQQLQSDFPGLTVRFRGNQAQIADSSSSLGFSVTIALFVLYAMLVIPFNSYSQPLLIMLAIPFGIIGAVLGHLIMGYGLSMVSVLGIIALSGVVVNDSLVMISYANEKRDEGASSYDAIKTAGLRRLRPIILTTVTTFGGLAPMIFETSRQAKFLIPMAISLGYGIVFATIICLLLVPAMYLILEDFRGFVSSKKKQVSSGESGSEPVAQS